MPLFEIMQKLVSKKFYATEADAQEKSDIYFSINRLTNEQYIELNGLISASYATGEVAA